MALLQDTGRDTESTGEHHCAVRWDALQRLRILDTPPEPAFDDLVQLAARLCKAPIAALTLLAPDRQWFKARLGLEQSETPLNESLCLRAAENDSDMLIIPDLRVDPVFQFHPAYLTGELRFYAGVPLSTREGVRVGALCVASTEPRPGLDPLEKEALSTLAAQAVAQMELRRTLFERDEALERERARSSELEWLMLHDPLTGLCNRTLFETKLEEVVASGPTGLLLMDLDQFKQVNDRFGQHTGDRLLRTIVERLDAGGFSRDVVARFGGDEFALILPNTGEARMKEIARGILRAMEQPVSIDGRQLFVKASIGGGSADAGSEAEALVRDADLALQAAKREGGARARFFMPRLLHRQREQDAMLDRARHALSTDGIVPFYQPKVNLFSGAITGFEALLRLPLPGGEVDYPAAVEAAFHIPDTAVAIGQTMLRQVASDIGDWHRQGLEFGRVSLNAGTSELGDPLYAARLIAALRKNGVPESLLEIEVTEKVLLDDDDAQVRATLLALRDAGIHIALDDFGTGYASLAHLDRWPVDTIKIDKSFVQDVERSESRARIIDLIVGLARDLSLETVAEGVETQGQADRLRHSGCRVAQGNLFWQALPAAAAALLLTSADAGEKLASA